MSAKAENVGSYENPFRVKNDSARNTLGIRSVTRRSGRKGQGEEEREELRRKSKKVSFSVLVLVRPKRPPKTTVRVKRKREAAAFGSQKGP